MEGVTAKGQVPVDGVLTLKGAVRCLRLESAVGVEVMLLLLLAGGGL